MKSITTQQPFTGVMSSLIGGRNENQDTCGFSETGRGLLLVVCDGMGGGPGGKTASYLATSTIINFVQKADKPELNDPTATGYGTNNETLLEMAVKAANKALRDKIIESPELNGMGTTVTAVLLTADSATVAHVGDSRVYQLRKSRIVFRTADHSRVAEMVRAGALSEEQARLSSISNLITRALGIGDEVDVDVSTVSYQKNDRFVLCTDGVWGAMPQPELVKTLMCNKSIETTADVVNADVESAGQLKGGQHDNYTMIMVDMLEDSAIQGKEPSKNKEEKKNGASTESSGIKPRIKKIMWPAAITTTVAVVAIVMLSMLKLDTPDSVNGSDNTADSESDDVVMGILTSGCGKPSETAIDESLSSESAKDETSKNLHDSKATGGSNTGKERFTKADTDVYDKVILETNTGTDINIIKLQIDSINHVIEIIKEIDIQFDLIRDMFKVKNYDNLKKSKKNIETRLNDLTQNYGTILTPEEKNWIELAKINGTQEDHYNGLLGILGQIKPMEKREADNIIDFANGKYTTGDKKGTYMGNSRIGKLLESLTSRKKELEKQINSNVK